MLAQTALTIKLWSANYKDSLAYRICKKPLCLNMYPLQIFNQKKVLCQYSKQVLGQIVFEGAIFKVRGAVNNYNKGWNDAKIWLFVEHCMGLQFTAPPSNMIPSKSCLLPFQPCNLMLENICSPLPEKMDKKNPQSSRHFFHTSL